MQLQNQRPTGGHCGHFLDPPVETTRDYSPATNLRVHGEEADVHMTTQRQRGKEVSRTSVAARGQPRPATVWKGMGPSGYNKPPTLARSLYIGFILILSAFFMSADANLLGLREGGRLGGGGSDEGGGSCDLTHCSNRLSQAMDQMFPQLKDLDRICKILTDFARCIEHTSGCEADLTYYTLRNANKREMRNNGCAMDEDGNPGAESRTSAGDGNSGGSGVTVGGGAGHKKAGGGRATSRPRGPVKVPAICQFKGPRVYRQCGLFGDPHLRTFQREYQTCKVKGTWPLISNDYLTVQVTNDPVPGNTEVTATSKLTVIVKGHEDCTSKNFKTYQAHSDSLPGTFDDGSVQVGPYHSLELVEKTAGAHVEIHIRYISTIVVVRRVGRYLTLLVQMPETIINGSSQLHAMKYSPSAALSAGSSSLLQDAQLCLSGCPGSEVINYQEYLALHRDSLPESSPASTEPLPTRAEAETECRDAGLVGYYFDSCVFDLVATGDHNFTISATLALRDALRLDPSAARTMDNRTSLGVYDELYSHAGATTASLGAAWWWRTTLTASVALAVGAGREHRASCVEVFLTVLTLLTLLCSR